MSTPVDDEFLASNHENEKLNRVWTKHNKG
jgi:hypothetical protein